MTVSGGAGLHGPGYADVHPVREKDAYLLGVRLHSGTGAAHRSLG